MDIRPEDRDFVLAILDAKNPYAGERIRAWMAMNDDEDYETPYAEDVDALFEAVAEYLDRSTRH